MNFSSFLRRRPTPSEVIDGLRPKLSRRYLLTSLAASSIALRPASAEATSRTSSLPPKLSPELEVLIKVLREGAVADREPHTLPDVYNVLLWWDENGDAAVLPTGYGRFFKIFQGDPDNLGALNYNELWRVWCDLMGIIGDPASAPITCGHNRDGYHLLFSRKYSRLERAACANAVINRLIERYIDHRQYIQSLPTPPLEA